MAAHRIATVTVLVSLLAAGAAPSQPQWSSSERELLRSFWLGEAHAPPPDPSNRFADDDAAAALGRSLFSDTRLSANGQVSCASCHQSDHGFTDALATGHGLASGNRRTMPVMTAAYSPWQFWDGRADSLWAQALGPIENPAEHGFTRIEVVRVLTADYRRPYEAIFGPLPDLSDPKRFPMRAAPAGDDAAKVAWSEMSDPDQAAINRAYANFGKSIAAFERTLRLRPTRFDAYVAGVIGSGPSMPLSKDEVAGLRLFIGRGQCANCHNGPLLSNQGFANTGVPTRAGLPIDVGRAEGIRLAMSDPFNCKGPYSDSPKTCDELEFAVAGSHEQVRAYKVPSLRGVAHRAPYMHAGQFNSLDEVLDHYSRAPQAPAGESDIRPVNLTATERRQVVAFLHTLDDGLTLHTR